MKTVLLKSDLVPNKIDEVFKKEPANVIIEKFIKQKEEIELFKASEERNFIKSCGEDDDTNKKEISDDSQLASRSNIVGTKVSTLGSTDEIYATHDVGLFTSVLHAYNNHWNLRMNPDDWWFTVIKHVAKIIDCHSKNNKVRSFFVNHTGKKELAVGVNASSIYDIDYSHFFSEMSIKIKQNINAPEYVDSIRQDFSTSTDITKIVSEITLMSSVQEFFEFKCQLMCGIPAVEMMGDREDWEKLMKKAKHLKELLAPIEDVLHLEKWFTKSVEVVFSKLLDTFDEKPDIDFWSRIMNYKRPYGSGMGGFTGWFLHFQENEFKFDELSEFSSGLVSVPVELEQFGVSDKSAMVGGIIGFKIHENYNSQGVPSVEPFQGWSLMLEENSPFRAPKK